MKQFMEILLGLDPGQISDADDWRLRWLGLPESGWAALALLAAVAAIVWLTVRSYAREGDAPRRAKVILAALRIAVIVAVVAMLARPALEFRRVHTDASTVLVLVDDSMSMSLVDSDQTATRLQTVLEALGRDDGALPRLRQDHPIWLAAFSTDAPDEAPYTRMLGMWNPPGDDARLAATAPGATGTVVAVVLVIVACTWLVLWLGVGSIRRYRLKAAGETPAPRPGLLLVSAAAVLVGFVAGTYAVNARRVGRSVPAAAPAAPAAEVDLAAEVRRTVADLEARGFHTDLVTTLRDGLDRLRGRRVAAVVLITDGQETGDVDTRRLDGVRDLLRLRGVRLMTVCAGDAAVRPNVRVASVILPAQVRLGARADAKIVVDGIHCEGRTATVRLFCQTAGGGEWIDTGLSTDVTFDAATDDDPSRRSRTVATLPVVCDQVGEFAYRAVADPVEGEPITHDNAARTPVTVSDAKIRILLISADSGWEFQYLRNFLLRDPDRYAVSVWQQNADASFNQQASTGMRLTRLPRTLGELTDGFDVVVLYDPAHTTGGFDATFAEHLASFVGTHRGGVAYIASALHTSDNLVASGPFDDLVNMLPVRVGREMLRISARIGRDTRVGWPIRLTGAGRDHPAMQLERQREANATAWRQLPGIFWSHAVEQLKPAAVALAVSSDPAEVSAANTPLPVVAAHMYGRGPVLYVGFDSTWRWRYVREGHYFRAFWSSVIDYLGSYRQMKRRIVLSAAGDTFTVGEPIRLTAEAYDEDMQPWSGDSFDVRLAGASGADPRVIRLTREGSGSGEAGRLPIFRRTVKLTAPGEYQLSAAGVDKDDLLARSLTVVLPQEEFDRPHANPDLLARLAGADDAIALDAFDTLADRIGPDRRRLIELSTRDLWNVPIALAVVAILLIAEWIGRKRYNMA